VTGATSGATWSWKGIPYAAPPVGALRFRPPRPASCWSGERVATAYGPRCPQVDPATTQVVGDEDCLTLNVWANEGLAAAPVLVFLHGGGNAAGSASDPLYDGEKLAAATGAVVVTLEYRIGALGFFAHAALNAESEHGVSGNYGLLDQIAALAWVRDNAAAFGGAPDHVMVFGESAGGVDAMALLVSPLAEGLFAAVGIESGGVYTTTLADGIAATKPVVDGVGCGDAADVAACLRGKSAAQLAAVPAAIGPLETGMHFKPVIDGHVLPEGSLARVERGAHNHVPVILGTNADETSRMVPAVTTDAQYHAAVRALYPAAAADALLALYPSSSYASPRAALVRLTTDTTWTCPARRIARALADHQSEPVFRYHLSWKAPGAVGAVTGATHGIELPHVFGNFDAVRELTPSSANLALSAQVQGYWGRLARARDPTGRAPSRGRATRPRAIRTWSSTPTSRAPRASPPRAATR
jgi:para-nitrobenzyl esterase